MQVIDKKVSELIPYKNNPRHNDDAVKYVANSIKEFGFKVPIIIDKDNVVVAGHTRLKASKKLGIKTVPCIVADDLTEEQIKAFRLADNKTAELAEWDLSALDVEIGDIFDIDMESFGFEVDTAMSEEVEEDDYDEAIPPEPVTKRGDLWKLGNHRLICGDSTDVNVIGRLMGGQKADMVFTDPPYGMDLDTDYSGMVNRLDFAKEKNFKGGKKYEQGRVDDFTPDMVSSALAMGAEEVFLWGADYYAELIPNKNSGAWIVWDKRANGNGDDAEDNSSDKMYGSCFELCWSKKKHKRDIARVKWAGVFGTEQEFDHKRVHPTQKPVKLVTWFLTRYSKEGQSIADIFGGSGSTLIACEQLNRKCFMCELDEHYCDVIIDRWEQYTGQKAELIEHGEDGQTTS